MDPTAATLISAYLWLYLRRLPKDPPSTGSQWPSSTSWTAVQPNQTSDFSPFSSSSFLLALPPGVRQSPVPVVLKVFVQNYEDY
jgi:hypothetical protein